jgi:hypothetical protein
MISFEKHLREELDSSIDDILSSSKKKPIEAGSRFFDLVLRVLKEFGANATKDDILAAVAKVYDDYLSKIDLPGEYDVVVHALLKQTVLASVAIAYDKIHG